MTALAGLRVLDLSRFIAGPYCAMLLGDMGAEVIKIEPPGAGEQMRNTQPGIDGQSYYTFMLNRNKKSLGLALRSAGAQAVLRELIAQADVLIENFLPGTMEKMGLGWEEVHALNPRLVMARISGFGQDGPLANKQCFDGVAQAMSGLMDMNGATDGPPTMIGAYVCDYTTGLYTALGILAAINARHATGKGQLVDVSLLESAISMLMTAIPLHVREGITTTRMGSRDRYGAPSNTYAAGDGRYVLVVGGGDVMFQRLARAMQQPALTADPRFVSPQARLDNREALEAVVSQWMRSLSADEAVARLEAQGMPSAKVATIGEVVANPQLRHRGAIAEIPFGDTTVPAQGVTIHLSDTPLTIRHAIPPVGAHNDDVLRHWLGYDDGRIAALQAQGAI
jgi:crotonobetainyl-CoA:carnitine CoA-transferase CaiB-like acyl-CoA transferase